MLKSDRRHRFLTGGYCSLDICCRRKKKEKINLDNLLLLFIFLLLLSLFSVSSVPLW
jgi:hypothetical protein